jgi:hypothetical protein
MPEQARNDMLLEVKAASCSAVNFLIGEFFSG